MMRLSTHVLDTARGVPATGMPVTLERQEDSGQWRTLSSAQTDLDGRCGQLLPSGEESLPGVYRLIFSAGSYHAAQGIVGLYPSVQVMFSVREGETHFHIPLLLSPHGYTTYRGT